MEEAVQTWREEDVEDEQLLFRLMDLDFLEAAFRTWTKKKIPKIFKELELEPVEDTKASKRKMTALDSDIDQEVQAEEDGDDEDEDIFVAK